MFPLKIIKSQSEVEGERKVNTPALETERLILRKFSKEDMEAFIFDKRWCAYGEAQTDME